ncbi:MAG: hypothetical protein C0399_03330 [Syntrophus sp. (in: bacteria)]|nr:hypothetical protein [Syntrophus sp. (in: bacteria)]
MTQCGDIENKLSAYLDGAVSAGEKQLIEEHLADCAHCSATLSELKKTGDLLRSLEEVDPPPWFTQKIMVRVREEATSKKGLFEKLFYPFHIKIPIEVMATCLVAVLVFSVYRTSGPEIKVLHEPQESLTTIPQELARKQDDGAPPAAKITSPGLKADSDIFPEKQKNKITVVVPGIKVRSGLQYDTDGVAPPGTAPERYMAENKSAIKGKYIEQEMKAEVSLRKSDSLAMQERAPSPAPLPKAAGGIASSQEGTSPEPVTAKKLRVAKELQPTAPMQQDRFSIALRTNNAETALRETEELLNRFGARHINIISRHDNFTILIADLPGQKIKEFLDTLKTIGNIKENVLPAPSQEEYIRISIEITANQ